MSAATIQRHRAGERVRLEQQRLLQLRGAEDVFDSGSTERCVRGIAVAQLWQQFQQLVASGERIADAVFVRGQNLLEGAVLEKVPDVETRGFVRRRAKARVETEVAEHEVGPAVAIQVGDLNGVPPTFGAREPYVRSPVDEVAVFLMKDA